MDALKAIAARHSTRSYTSKSVPKETLEKIADRGRRAATARNVQPGSLSWSRTRRRARSSRTSRSTASSSLNRPLVSRCSARTPNTTLRTGVRRLEHPGRRHGPGRAIVLGCRRQEALLRRHRARPKVPEGYKLISLVAIGYGEDPGKPTPKRPLSEVIHWGEI